MAVAQPLANPHGEVPSNGEVKHKWYAFSVNHAPCRIHDRDGLHEICSESLILYACQILNVFLHCSVVGLCCYTFQAASLDEIASFFDHTRVIKWGGGFFVLLTGFEAGHFEVVQGDGHIVCSPSVGFHGDPVCISFRTVDYSVSGVVDAFRHPNGVRFAANFNVGVVRELDDDGRLLAH